MKVLFIIERPKVKSNYLTQLQPLGILYIASYLESKGIMTDVIDFNVSPGKKFDYREYDMIGYSMISANIENTLSSIKKVKSENKNAKIIIGGPLVSLIPEKLISINEIDALIEGEAEETVYNYLTKKDKKSVKGLWIKINNQPYYTGKPNSLDKLDFLPFPAFEKVPYTKYNVVLKKRWPVASIITSRGCPYRCIFCSHALGFKFRSRSPKNVIEEIKRDIKLGIKELWIADDNFTFDMNRAEKICDLMVKNKFDISFTLANGVRADRLNEKILLKLKKAGCWLLSISPETGSQKTLKMINKGFTFNDAVMTRQLCKKLDIKVMSNFIIGFPWEKEEDICQTINFAKKLDADISHFSRLLPMPETPLWKLINNHEYGLLDNGENFGGLKYTHPFLNDDTCLRLIQRAYRETMLRPVKILNLAKTLHIKDLITLGKYSLFTKSI